MIQHPLPQNVTGYQFRLIGDMTIKQFVFLSGGVAAAVFFYYTNLFSLLKWFFVILSGMSGFAIAFLPLEERPLDQWILNYLRAIYRPTRFIWRKTPQSPEYFTYSPKTDVSLVDLEEVSRLAAARREQGLKSFLVTLPQENINADSTEQTYINYVSGLFAAPMPSVLPKPSAPASSFNINNLTPSSVFAPANTDSSHASPVVANKPKRKVDETIPSGVINLQAIKIEKDNTPRVEAIKAPLFTAETVSDTFASGNSPTVIDVGSTIAATTDSDLPFPSAPSTPNTLVGMVLDNSGKIVENAIIEVIDEIGLPVRATKTNQLGQFFSTTPLKRGTYRLIVDKQGLTFTPIELTLTGDIVSPLKIQASNGN